MSEILIRADELATAIAGGEGVRLLDVRGWLGCPDGRPDFELGHIPGAAYADLDTELSVPPDQRQPVDGRHPLPTEGAFQDDARRWGIRSGDLVVAYDDRGNQSAARAWWLLRHGGFEKVRLLDGGLGAWREAGLPLETGPGTAPKPGDVELSFGAMPLIPLQEVGSFARFGVLLDARAAERYRGEAEPVDPRAGHIPGAVSAPTVENLDANGYFLPAEQLRARFAALGVTDAAVVGAYCGSGVTGSHEVAALAIAGFEAALFPGSWSQWSNHPDLPVATGPKP